MLATLRYPLVLRHVPKGMQAERYLACSRVASVRIAEVAETDAPVVVSWTPEDKGSGVPRRFRSVNGEIMGQVSSARTKTCRDDESFPCVSLVKEAQAILSRIALEKGPRFILPEGRFINPSRWSDVTDTLPTGFNAEDERFWDDRFRNVVRALVCVDGGLWRVSPEPLICVHRNAYGWHTSIVTSQEIGQDLMRLHFTLDRWEEARDTCRRLAQGKPVRASTLDYDASHVPTTDTDIIDVSDVVARIVAIVNAETYARSSRTTGNAFGTRLSGIDWSGLPTDLFSAYATLRQFCDREGPADEQSVSVAVDALQTLVDLSGCRGLSWLLPQADSVRAHIEKWNARSVSFDPTLAASPATRHGF